MNPYIFPDFFFPDHFPSDVFLCKCIQHKSVNLRTNIFIMTEKNPTHFHRESVNIKSSLDGFYISKLF